MIARENCVTAEELDELLSGRLPPERFAAAMEHVDACQVCASKAAGRPITAWTASNAAVESTGYTHEPECQAVIGQLLLQPNSATAGNRDGQPLPIDSLGPYRLRRWLGSGGMGAVYLAEHERLKRLAAIKLLPRDKLLQSGWPGCLTCAICRPRYKKQKHGSVSSAQAN